MNGRCSVDIEDKRYSPATIVIWAVAFLVILLLAIFVNLVTAIVTLLFLLAFWLKLNPQVPYALALVVLLLCALMTLIEQTSAAQSLANWAYCFFAIGVALHLYDFLKTGADDNEAG